MKNSTRISSCCDFLIEFDRFGLWRSNGIIFATPSVVEEYSKRIHERVEEVLDGKDIDETRIIQEVAIFADRVAIDEELVRLRSHIDQFTKIIKETGNEPCGRKLDFLLQEINREINTTGSKCNNADIAKVVVDAKSEVEKIREQVQNIE